METLKEAKEYLKANWENGTTCPCCKQYVKLYKRPIHSGMAYGLIAAYKLGGANDFIHIPSVFTENKIGVSQGEFAKLRYWGLIEQAENHDELKRTSGFWKLTMKGIEFVDGRLRVASRVHIYNGKAIEFDTTELVNIRECLGDKFNYSELMNS